MVLKFDDVKTQVISELNKRVPNLVCPICKSGQMVLADGFISHQINKELTNSFLIGGSTVPVVAIICKNCGHVMEFSVGVLGLLPKKDEEATKQPREQKGSPKK